MERDKPTVYVETSVISYYVARLSDQLRVAGHQKSTRDWWENDREYYRAVISVAVLGEITQGDPEMAAKRLDAIAGWPVLLSTPETEKLIDEYMRQSLIPVKAVRDAAHIALATVHEVDYLLTWNFRHIANAHVWKRIQHINERHGYAMPIVCTVEGLHHDQPPETEPRTTSP